MIRMIQRPAWVLLVCAVLLMLVSGCDLTLDDKAFIRSLAEDWMRSKNIHPLNEDGSPSLIGVYNLGRRAVGFSTGDKEADAVLDARDVISNLAEADKVMDEGRAIADAAGME